MPASASDTQARLYHLYQKLQNCIQDESKINEIMVDVRTLVSQAVAERTATNRKIDHVGEVFGTGWWDEHSDT